MEKSRKPKIRFKGFTDDWEQRKLSGILCEKNERTSDFNSFPLYSLTIENGITPKTNRYERSSLVTKTEDLFKIVNQNEFVTNPMNLRFGALGYNKNPHYISVSGYYDVFSIDNDKCSAFWNSYFKTVSVMNVFDNAATGSLIEKRRVKYSTLKQISLLMPIELREKQKIGSFFEDIDELITLHQRKLDKLINVKKSMLEKMFPKQGSTVPEIRFNGFTQAWEQRELGEVAKYRNGKAHENDISEHGEYVVVNSKFVSTDGEVCKFSNKQIEPLYKDEIAFVLSDVPNGRAIARTFLVDKNDKYTLNQRIAGITPAENVCPYFLHILMNRNIYFLQFDDGAKQTNLSITDVMEFEEYYPSNEEQNRIGRYFENLDRLITLHQRKLEKLKNIKKSMLEKMFI